LGAASRPQVDNNIGSSEGDCKILVDDVHSNHVNHSEYGLIVRNCRSLLQNFNNHEVVFTSRQENRGAHALAKALYLMLHAVFLM